MYWSSVDDMRHVDPLIEKLAAREHETNLANPYRSGKDPNDAIRRHNLRLYFADVFANQTPPLLVCEAPGYRGCRLTGIPLCSRRILVDGISGLQVFGGDRGYREPTDCKFSKIQGEQSATIVWSELSNLGIKPLIWNAFPWHPHREHEPLSNRTPTKNELIQGREILTFVIQRFRISQVLAIGRLAQESLSALAVPFEYARHPAHGGKQEFSQGLRSFVARL